MDHGKLKIPADQIPNLGRRACALLAVAFHPRLQISAVNILIASWSSARHWPLSAAESKAQNPFFFGRTSVSKPVGGRWTLKVRDPGGSDGIALEAI